MRCRSSSKVPPNFNFRQPPTIKPVLFWALAFFCEGDSGDLASNLEILETWPTGSGAFGGEEETFVAVRSGWMAQKKNNLQKLRLVFVVEICSNPLLFQLCMDFAICWILAIFLCLKYVRRWSLTKGTYVAPQADVPMPFFCDS